MKPFYKRDPATTIFLTAIIFLASQLLAAILIGLYPAVRNFTEAEAGAWLQSSVAGQFAYILLAEILAIFFVVQCLRLAKVTLQRIGLVRPALRDIGYALVAYGLYFLSYLAVIIVAQLVLPGLDYEQEQQIGFEGAYSGGELLLTYLSLAVLPPIAEEIIFRGFLFTSLRAKFRLRYAVIITSLLFGVAHLQFGANAPLLWVAAIDTFILSCFLCYLRERSGSVWPPVLLHGIKNSIAFVILFGPRFLY